MASPDELAGYIVLCDSSDGCHVGFTLRVHSVGTHGLMLDGVVVRLFEVFTPEHPNSLCHTLYYRNHGYTLTEIVHDEDKVGDDRD